MLFRSFWQGVGRSLSPIIGAIVPNVAGYFGPHLTTMREHPAMFFSMIAFLIWLYIRGVSIAKEIVELIDQAWMRAKSKLDVVCKSTRKGKVSEPPTFIRETDKKRQSIAWRML